MKSKSKVSIILPVSNASRFLSRCLDSLLKQTYTNFEVIAIDDFSKDDSFTILKTYRKKDKRIKISRNVKKYGLQVTLNRCLKQSHGQYIAFMNATDIATPDRLKRQIQYLINNAKTVAVGTQCRFIDENTKLVSKSDFPLAHEIITKTLINGVSMQFESVLINTYRLPKDMLKFENKKYPFIYADLLVKLLQYGLIANLRHNLYYRLKHEHEYLRTIREHVIPHMLLWVRARVLSDNKPSFQSLFYPLLKQI